MRELHEKTLMKRNDQKQPGRENSKEERFLDTVAMLPGFYLRPEGAKRIWPGAQPPDRRPTGNKPQGGERNSGYRTRNSRCLEVSPLRGLKPLGANPGAAPPAKSFRPHSGPRERNGFVPVTLLQCRFLRCFRGICCFFAVYLSGCFRVLRVIRGKILVEGR